MKEAILKRWNGLPIDDIIGVMSFLFEYVSGSRAPVLLTKRKALKTIAAMTKRGWFSVTLQDTPQTKLFRDWIFSNIGMVLLESQDLTVKQLGVVLCKEIIKEFSSPVNAEKTFPNGFHSLARISFEHTCLRQLFVYALRIVYEFNISKSEEAAPKKVVLSALSLIQKIFSWNFENAHPGVNQEDTFNPGEYWREILIERNDVLELFYQTFIQHSNDSKIVLLTTECLESMASISSKTFGNEKLRRDYFQKLIIIICNIIASHYENPITHNIGRLFMFFQRVAVDFPPDLFRSVVKYQNFFEIVSQYTVHLFKNYSFNQTSDIMDIIEFWDIIVNYVDHNNKYQVEVFRTICGEIFENFIYLSLQRILEQKEKDCSEFNLFFGETDIASIGRMNIEKSLSILNEELDKRLKILIALGPDLPSSWTNDMTRTLHVLLCISTQLLKSEESVVPEEISLVSALKSPEEDPVLLLINNIFTLVSMEEDFYLKNKGSPFPPLVSLGLSIFLVDISPTYIFACESSSENLMESFSVDYIDRKQESFSPTPNDAQPSPIQDIPSLVERRNKRLLRFSPQPKGNSEGDSLDTKKEDKLEEVVNTNQQNLNHDENNIGLNRKLSRTPLENRTKAILNSMVNKAVGNILSEHVEGTDEAVCLLATLKKRSVHLMQIPSWIQLVDALRTDDVRLNALVPTDIFRLTWAIMNVDFGTEAEKRTEYLKKILLGFHDSFPKFTRDFVRAPLFSVMFERNLEKIRGLVYSVTHPTAQPIYSFVFPVLRKIQENYHTIKPPQNILILLLKIWRDVACYLIPLLPDNQHDYLELTVCFLEKCSDALQPKQRRHQTDSEKVTIALSLLYEISLLTHEKVARTLYYGISVIIPSMMASTKVYDIFQKYNTVLLNTFRNHIDKLPRIPAELFQGIWKIIPVSLEKEEAILTTLEIIYKILEFYFSFRLKERNDPFNEQHYTVIKEQTVEIFKLYLKRDLIRSHIPENLISDTFFGLICLNSFGFQDTVQKLLAQQPPELVEPLTQGLYLLQEGVQLEYNEKNKTAFRANFRSFTTGYQGLLWP
eukprot:TRINITY_DN5405_c0_g1_i1.p1 TRINITY_DN5405_c0_g1~~TRINITY_DN5405_c0_g1_i1.p1  ORF type:complete len:1145 (-),score=196.57 TRINITY_DN5405_c0_g1_i1:42-3230(-)